MGLRRGDCDRAGSSQPPATSGNGERCRLCRRRRRRAPARAGALNAARGLPAKPGPDSPRPPPPPPPTSAPLPPPSAPRPARLWPLGRRRLQGRSRSHCASSSPRSDEAGPGSAPQRASSSRFSSTLLKKGPRPFCEGCLVLETHLAGNSAGPLPLSSIGRKATRTSRENLGAQPRSSGAHRAGNS